MHCTGSLYHFDVNKQILAIFANGNNIHCHPWQITQFIGLHPANMLIVMLWFWLTICGGFEAWRSGSPLLYRENPPSILFPALFYSLNFPALKPLSYLSPRSSAWTDLLLVLLSEWLIHDTWPVTQHPSLQISATLYFSLSFRRRPSLGPERFTGFSWISRGFVGNLHRLQLFSLARLWASESPYQVGLLQLSSDSRAGITFRQLGLVVPDYAESLRGKPIPWVHRLWWPLSSTETC